MKMDQQSEQEHDGQQQHRDRDTDAVKVVVRVRPPNRQEQQADIVHVDGLNSSVRLTQPPPTSSSSASWSSNNANQVDKTFAFDAVFGPASTQLDVYNRVARPIVDNVLEGYNGTIFAYGQTGTGKTFTMEGEASPPQLRGIIPNSFAHIFGHMAKADDSLQFLVRVSYLEIYNEEIRDLLCSSKPEEQPRKLEVKERPDVGVYVKDLSTFVVNNADDMDKLMTIGKNKRSVGDTLMNAHSSRSHAIFTITIECSEKGADGQHHLRVGKLHLVDLAGSERQSKTQAKGKRLKEATKINQSLSTLGNVISALVDRKSSHVPYRNSKLTRLLQDSLGGNSRTLMFANVGPAAENYDETLSTLRYANRAKNIQNHARVNEDPKDALMKQYQKEIEHLRKLLEAGQDGDDSGEDWSQDDDEDNEDGDDGEERKHHQHQRRASTTAATQQDLDAMKEQIESERKRLREVKNMAEEERNRTEEALQRHEGELKAAQAEHDDMRRKLHALERKIIVGGENLLEKAEQQQKLLEESDRELQETIGREESVRRRLREKEAERVDIEEKYSSLQEEAAGKTRKLKKVWTTYQAARSELQDLQAEQQREMEGLLDSVRQLTRELRLQMLVVDSFVPPDQQEVIESAVEWSEDVGEWQLQCVAYTGNNMRRRRAEDDGGGGYGEKGGSPSLDDFSHVYLRYGDQSDRPRTAAGKKEKGGKSGRPKSSRAKQRK